MTRPDSIRIVRDRAVELEQALDAQGATGNGLGEKYRSLNLGTDLQACFRQIVHLRNQVMHDGKDLTDDELARYDRLARTALKALKPQPEPAKKAPEPEPEPAWTLTEEQKAKARRAWRIQIVASLLISAALVGFAAIKHHMPLWAWGGLSLLGWIPVIMVYGWIDHFFWSIRKP